jgi:hypothetical protein
MKPGLSLARDAALAHAQAEFTSANKTQRCAHQQPNPLMKNATAWTMTVTAILMKTALAIQAKAGSAVQTSDSAK